MNLYNLSIYDKKPDIEVTIDNLEKITISRLKTLKWIDHQKLQKRNSLIRHKTNLYDNNTKYLEDILKQNNLYRNYQYDSLSHFICRLAFTEIEEYSSWFIKQEVTLFEYKYKLEMIYGYKGVIKQIESSLFDITYPLYTVNDIIVNDLNGRYPIPYFQFSHNLKIQQKTRKYFPFHIIPFDICSNKLISQRKVYIRNGYAFIPDFFWPEIVTTKYMKFLKNKMKETKQALLRMKNNDEIMRELSKIIHIIKGLHKISLSIDHRVNLSKSRYLSTNYNKDYIIEFLEFSIDKYINLFPVCMRYSYETLMLNGHLKNDGRIQLTLFLKGIGLSLEECLLFFKKRLTKKGSGNNFINNYAYFIKHQYGKVGALKNYTPFSCNKIIQKSENKIKNNDYNGCPFKLLNNITLTTFISKYYNINLDFIKTQIKFDQYYQVQCKKLFCLLNEYQLFEKKVDIEDIYNDWNHPNNYFKIGYDLQCLDEINFKQKHVNIVKSKSITTKHITIHYDIQ